MESEKSVGTILRETRLSKGISLVDVEKISNVRARYLEAIENDDYDKLPGEVFVRGIIRNYGNYLGLDGLELVNMYKAGRAGVSVDKVRSSGIREADRVRLNVQLRNTRDIGSGTGKFELSSLPLRQIIAGLLVIVILCAGYFAVPAALDYFKSQPQAEPKQEQQAIIEQAEPAPQAVPYAVSDKVLVEMEASGQCWLEVNADGAEAFAGMLNSRDKKSFEAKDKLIIKYGNIGVMKVSVNGQQVDLQGEHGVAVKTYTRENNAK